MILLIGLRIHEEKFRQYHKGVVGMLLSPYAFKSFDNIEKTLQRIMCVAFHRNPCTTLVSWNSLTNAWD